MAYRLLSAFAWTPAATTTATKSVGGGAAAAVARGYCAAAGAAAANSNRAGVPAWRCGARAIQGASSRARDPFTRTALLGASLRPRAPPAPPAASSSGVAGVKAVSAGDRFPSGSFGVLKDGSPSEVSTDQVFSDKTVVICGVPGAFTGTCNAKHLPGFVELVDQFRAKGAEVACLATNDAFAMDAWMKMRMADGKVMPLSDGDASLLKQMGLVMDTGKFGGVRSVRFSMIVQDGVVKKVNVEEGGKFTDASSAETALSQLSQLQ